MSSRTDCRKFAPNIFNKSKCTNCFRQKEEHSAEALECNRASRKVSKCGYLFVAPGWDFSDPLNRTKRWQRRWFVLYDDGELNYSVDEHPDTVPQAVVDMNQVLEVSGAEDVTGHTFSIAITAPDRVHFVKATCREEARWWSDVLSVFTRSKGRHKRNATFPGGQSTTIIQAPQATVRSGTPNPIRPRYNSCHTESTVTSLQRSWGGSSLQTPTAIADTVPTRDTTPPSSLPQQSLQGQSESVRSPANSPALVESRTVYKDQPASSASPPTRDKINSEEKARCRRDKRCAKINNLDWLDTCKQRQDSISKQEKDAEAQSTAEQQHLMLLDEYEQQTKRDEKLKDIAAVLTRPRVRRPTPSPVPISASHQQQQQPTRDTPSSRQQDEIDTNTTEKLLRGDPDGCGLDLGVHHHQQSQRYSPNSELRVDLPAEDLLHIRKGWLSKRAHDQQWNRHWFVLHGAALKYYRDPSAEDRGIMDGVIDLNGVTSVSELQLTRNFGFQLVLWEESCFQLSAVTAGVRNNWISVIKRAAGLSESSDTVESSDISMVEKEPIVPTTPITPITPRSMLFSSDEEYRTASEGGRRESGEWCEPLPPSPPLTRTPISRVKERARSRSSSGSRICKRSRSSPPSSRRSTIDSVKTDDLILPCCGEELPEIDSSLVEMLESEVKELRERLENSQNEAMNNNLTHIVEKQANEIEDLKKQLNNALNEINNTEKEVARLRQIKTEAKMREKRMEELLATLENTERQLNERAEDMEMLKHMYGQDKELWENRLTENELLLRDATERCELLSGEVTAGRHTVEQLQNELSALSERLVKGIDENDALYKRICELEGKSSGLRMSKDKTRSVDSLSDLTNIDLDLDFRVLDKERVIEEYDELRSRFEKAVQEIRAMKKELRESHIVYDELELTNIKLRQDMKLREESDESQVGLMAARIQDLTLKLTASDKQVRTLKQKLQDSREKRRSLSLKGGRESFSIGKEVEEKLSELESKISALESGRPVIGKMLKHSPKRDRSVDRQSPINDRGLKRMSARLRRKSLDTATSSEPMKVLIRLSSLESKVSSISENIASPDVLLSPTEENAVSIATSSESLNQLDASTISISDNEMTPRLQILENVVSSARDKVNECLCQLSLLKSSRSKRSPSPIDRRFDGVRSIEKCLSELGNLLRDGSSENSSFTRSVSNAEINAISESVKSVVKSLEHVLRTKLQEIASRRIVLRKDGKLDSKMYLQLLAEKLAYESVIVGRIHDTLNSTGCYDNTLSNRLMKAEIVETSHLLSNLKRKLAGKCPKRQYGSKLSIDYLTKVLANKLIKTGHITSQVSPNESSSSQIKNSVTDKMVNYLISKRDEVNVALTLYKTTKLEQLANALASETLSYISEKELPQEKYSPLNELKIREAWQIAQETVNNELIQSEITHVMMRCAQMYETTIATDHDAFFSFYASERASLELWADAVEDKLREAMTENLRELSEAYESCLTKLRRQSRGQWKQHPEQDHAMNESRELLAEFADITAHKALVDARISVLSSELKQSEFSNAEKEDSTVESLMQDDMFISSLSDCGFHINEDCLIDAEFQFLYQHYSRECRAVIGGEPLTSQDKVYIREVMETLALIEKELNKIEKYVGQNNNSDDEVTDNEISSVEVTDWNSVCGKCSNLHHRIVELTACVLQRQNCKQCEQLQDTVHRLSSEHEEKVRVLQRSQEASLGELRGALENERASQAQLRERARRLEKRLGTLDSEYSQQVESLRAAYNMTLTTASLDRGLQGEENVRQRYQVEIEQLRALCEKGLVAMESSHRRVISELEDKHRREREQLRLEKEQALAEETQATLAALDAMRKAHESEVQREITKFKAEFIKKMQSSHDIGALHQEHQEQMEEIKKEILSLSEKYSVKCVESAALEEQLAKLSNQLAQAQQHIMQLDSRNKQLRAHLISDGNDMNICSSSRRERDDTGRLQKQLHATKMHGDRLVAVCIALRASRSNGALTPDCPLWDELHRLTGSWHHVTCTGVLVGSASGGSGVQEQCVASRNTQFSEPSALSIAELIRFPKLPMHSEPPLLKSVHRQPSPGPLAGMVAERKKRFELTK